MRCQSIQNYHISMGEKHIQRGDEEEGSVGGPEMLELRPYFAH